MPILILFTAFALFVFFNVKKDMGKSSFQEYLEDDFNSNFSPKKEISPSFFVSPNVDVLPINNNLDATKYPLLASRQKAVLVKSEKKMICFDEPISNKELKQMFGVANLELISTFEDNYRKYILALLRWAEELINNDLYDDAVLVLQESIAFGSDFRKSYTLLGKIYKEWNDTSNLQILYDKAYNSNSISKEYICGHIKALLKETE